MPLRKQPLVHVFPGEEALREPEPPPNRIIRDPNLYVDLALVILAGVAGAVFALASLLFS